MIKNKTHNVSENLERRISILFIMDNSDTNSKSEKEFNDLKKEIVEMVELSTKKEIEEIIKKIKEKKKEKERRKLNSKYFSCVTYNEKNLKKFIFNGRNFHVNKRNSKSRRRDC